jgi:Kef-type K+ transport system membrane component KefB
MDNATIFTLTIMVLCYAVISALVKRWYVAPALIFMLCGMALGPFGLGAIKVGNEVNSFLLPAELALTLILFNQASALDLSAVVRRGAITFRLLVIGIPLSLGLGTLTGALAGLGVPTACSRSHVNAARVRGLLFQWAHSARTR